MKTRKLSRLEEKRKRKAEQRSKYEVFQKAGINGKRARIKAGLAAKNRVRPHTHPLGPCGNIGCAECSDEARAIKEMRLAARGKEVAQ